MRANLVIAGVTKAGTTALLHYLAQHPEICGERFKEAQLLLTHAGDPAAVEEGYDRQFRHWNGERYRLESSPAYFPAGPDLLDGGAPTRVIIVLRDPVRRIWSGYRMKRRKGLVPDTTFETFVADGLAGSDDPLHRVFSTSRYARHLRPWLERHGDDLLVLFFEDLIADTPGAVARVCEWLGLDTTVVADFRFAVHNRGVTPRSRRLHTAAAAANRVLALPLRRRVGLRSRLLGLYERLGTTSPEVELPDAVAEQLVAAHRQEAVELVRLLREHGRPDRLPWGWATPSAQSADRVAVDP